MTPDVVESEAGYADPTRPAEPTRPAALRPQDAVPRAPRPSGTPPESFAPESFAPESVTPGGFAPESLAPESLAPESFEPGGFEPGGFAPGSFEPGGFEPGRVAPGGFAPESPMRKVASSSGPTPAGFEVGAVGPGTRAGEPADSTAGFPPGPAAFRPAGLAPDLVHPAPTMPPAPQAPSDAAPPAGQRKRRGRSRGRVVKLASLLCALAVLIIAGVTGVSRSEPSVTASVKAFLLAWMQGDYAAAANLTTGSPVVVARELKAAYVQLGAEDLSLKMGNISVHGGAAHAYFHASIDLGRGGPPWQYQGGFDLRSHGSGWLVVWSPSVITPGLGPSDRLAVRTTVPARRPLSDSAGDSLIPASQLMEVGVVPDQVKDPTKTARALARVTRLVAAQADEMRGQILAAPPSTFLELFKLRMQYYRKLLPKLERVPDLIYRQEKEPLFDSVAPDVTGMVGTEADHVLVADGDPYRPGTTVGETGLQQAFQSTLAGTPTTQVVVQDAAGRQVRVLYTWPGEAGRPVRTTIDGGIQRAAQNALAGLPYSAAIVAVRADTGQILAVASRRGGGMPAVSPLTGRYLPGQAFTIVSTAAVFSWLPHYKYNVDSPIECSRKSTRVGGQVFSNVPQERVTVRKFGVDFANACSTAFPALAIVLKSSDLASTAQQFGVGVPWELPISAFVGSMRQPGEGNSGERAADMIGTGSVRVSPLNMALIAAAVQSGSWHQPSLVVDASEPGQTPRHPFKSLVISQLRQLMAQTVASGAARGARVPGAEVFGQVGSAKILARADLRAIWFVGYRGNVAFAVLAFSRYPDFTPAVNVAHTFAAALQGSS